MIHIERPLRCQNWCCFCCLQHVEVQSPPGTVIGSIKQDISFIYPWFSVENASGEVVLKIKGPLCTCKWCEVEFQVCFLPFYADKQLLSPSTIPCRYCQLMVVRRWVRLPSSGLGWPRSTSLMQTTLEYNVSQTFYELHAYGMLMHALCSSNGFGCGDEGSYAWSYLPHCKQPHI